MILKVQYLPMNIRHSFFLYLDAKNSEHVLLVDEFLNQLNMKKKDCSFEKVIKNLIKRVAYGHCVTQINSLYPVFIKCLKVIQFYISYITHSCFNRQQFMYNNLFVVS
jgi:hypothetical protein